MQDYDAVLALMPSNVNALLRKGQVLQSMGKQAVSCWLLYTPGCDHAGMLGISWLDRL